MHLLFARRIPGTRENRLPVSENVFITKRNNLASTYCRDFQRIKLNKIDVVFHNVYKHGINEFIMVGQSSFQERTILSDGAFSRIDFSHFVLLKSIFFTISR